MARIIIRVIRVIRGLFILNYLQPNANRDRHGNQINRALIHGIVVGAVLGAGVAGSSRTGCVTGVSI